MIPERIFQSYINNHGQFQTKALLNCALIINQLYNYKCDICHIYFCLKLQYFVVARILCLWFSLVVMKMLFAFSQMF